MMKEERILIKNPDKSVEDTNEEIETAQNNCSEEKCEKKEQAKTKSKSKKQDKALLEKEKEIAELKDTYLRLLAEYDNFKKRTQKEKEAIYIDSVGDTVMALLPVIDNFERALASFSDEEKEKDLYKGIEMIYNQTIETFEKIGVKKIEALGCEFDPLRHNAIMHIDDESIADNTIVEEFQKGYTYRDKVIRYSMVKVAN
ncbi:MAG: nucleotide exchange factor GrpE [Ruminococcaceae bacterium]|nr:nucleotide exchange factor GrpE [Oscillospiraceae bacterium]